MSAQAPCKAVPMRTQQKPPDCCRQANTDRPGSDESAVACTLSLIFATGGVSPAICLTQGFSRLLLEYTQRHQTATDRHRKYGKHDSTPVCASVDPTRLQTDEPAPFEYPGDQQKHPCHSKCSWAAGGLSRRSVQLSSRLQHSVAGVAKRRQPFENAIVKHGQPTGGPGGRAIRDGTTDV